MTHNRRDFLAMLGGAFAAPLLGLSAGCGTDEGQRKRDWKRTIIVKPVHRKPPAEKLLRTKRPYTDAIPAIGARLGWDNARWRAQLDDQTYRILREGSTEPAWLGENVYQQGEGLYHCAGCNAPLFSSKTKYESNSGWPSFWDILDAQRVGLRPDHRHNLRRTEVFCRHCGAHLGHVFEDEKTPTKKRYCVNSLSLFFRPGVAQQPAR